MPKNILSVNEGQLKTTTLPSHGGRYAVVSHGYIIDQVLQELEANGFEIKDTMYTSNINGEVAQGVYHLNYSTDEELGLMFAWGNSYDKSMRFRCAIGAYVFASGSGLIAGDMSNYGRKHVGDAKDEVTDHIKSQIKIASKYYNQLVADKNIMQDVELTKDQIALLLGTLYISDEIVTSSQMILIKDQLKNPAHTYNASADSLWTIYNHVIYALKKSHPRNWMEAQKDLHKVVKSMFFPVTPAVDPNQIDLVDAIDDVTLVQVDEPATTEQINDLTMHGLEEAVNTEPEEEISLSLDDYPTTPAEEVAQPLHEETVEPVTPEEDMYPDHPEVEAAECKCGRTSDENGFCDGTHATPKTDETGLLLVEPEIVAHVETDAEYAERVADIEGEPEEKETTIEMSVPEGKEFNTSYSLDEVTEDVAETEVKETAEVIETDFLAEEVTETEEEVVQPLHEETVEPVSEVAEPKQEENSMSEESPFEF